MRDKYRECIYNLMKDNQRIISVFADSGTEEYSLVREAFPDRIAECGIAEGNAVGVAAGLSACGYIPIIYGMGAFLAYRAFEFIRNDICIQNRNVKIVGSGGGIGYNNLGPTHHTTEDIAVMTALPNMTVISPSTPLEVNPIMRAAVAHKGPVYVRFGKAFEEEIFESSPDFKIGTANCVRSGKDIAVFVTGSLIADAVRAADVLKMEGIELGIYNISSLKPIDEKTIIRASATSGRVLTIEEHNLYGGLNSLVANVLVRAGIAVSFKSICFSDEFCFEYGWRQEIRKKYGICENGICVAARGLME